MSSRFARPDTTTITMSNGDTLVVKRRLNALESRRMKAMRDFATLAEPAVVIAYLVDWSIVDDDGKHVAFDAASPTALASALDALDEDVFDDLYATMAVHVAAMKAERDAEKNGKGGAIPSSAISPSLSVAAGA